MDTTDTSRVYRPSPAPVAADGSLRLPRGVMLGFLLLVSFGTGVVLSILGPTVPAIAARLGVADGALGVIFTASFLAATVTTATAGALFNRIGARALIPTGLAAMAVGLLGQGAAPTLPLLAVGAVLAGAGVGIINVAVNAAASRLFPARRDTILTWLNVSFGVGAFFTPLVAGLSLTRLGGYMPAYLVGAVVLALPILPLLRGLPAATGDATRPVAQRAPVRALLRDPHLRLLMALAALYLGAEIGFGGWVVSIIAEMAHVPPTRLAPAASAFWICLAVGGAPTVWLLRRGISPRHLIVGGALAAVGASVLLLAVAGTVPLAIVCCALMGLAFAPILPMTTAQAAAQGVADGSDGARMAAIFTAGQLGGAIFPALQGALLGVGPAFALALTIVCALAMAALGAVVAAKRQAQ